MASLATAAELQGAAIPAIAVIVVHYERVLSERKAAHKLRRVLGPSAVVHVRPRSSAVADNPVVVYAPVHLTRPLTRGEDPTGIPAGRWR